MQLKTQLLSRRLDWTKQWWSEEIAIFVPACGHSLYLVILIYAKVLRIHIYAFFAFCVLTHWRWIMSRGVQGRFFRSNQDIRSLRMELDWTAKKVIHGVGLWRVVAVRWCQIKEMAFITNASIISQIMRIALTDYKIILKLIWKLNIRIGMSKKLITNCSKSSKKIFF